MSQSIPPAQPVRVRSTCDVCLDAKVRCSRDRPSCRRCLHHGRDCVYSNKRRLGRPRGTTSRGRTASQSTESAGTYTALSMDETAQPMSVAYAGNASSDIPHGLPSSSVSLYTQPHMPFGAPGHNDYSFYPGWQAGFGSDQGTSDTSGHDLSMSSQVDSRFDHDQHQIYGSAYTELDPSSLNISTHPPTFITNAGTTAPLDNVETSLELNQDADCGFSTMLLRPVYNTLHDGQRILLPVMTTGIPPVENTTSMASVHSSPCCSCYSDILTRLSELKQNNSGVSTSELDQIMRLEMDIRIQILAMVRCESCLFERPRALLLVGVVLESVLDLLECVCVVDRTMDPSERVIRPSLLTSSSDSSSGYGSDQMYQISPPSTTFQHNRYERAGLLRQLVRARLHEVLGLTRHLHEHVRSCRAWASNLTAADTTMAEIGNRVCALMNRLEG